MPSHKDDKIKDNFINIFSNTDTRMKELGQILKTPKSRKIYQILMDKELHTKEIGVILENSENPRLPNLTSRFHTFFPHLKTVLNKCIKK